MDFPSSHRITQWRQNAQNDLDGEEWETETEEEGDEDAHSEPERNTEPPINPRQDDDHNDGDAEREDNSNAHDPQNTSLQG